MATCNAAGDSSVTVFRGGKAVTLPLLACPVCYLDLSVRGRKCTTKLGISTIGELVQRTGAELLTQKNFGELSLDFMRAQLAKRGLTLRGENLSDVVERLRRRRDALYHVQIAD